MSRLRDRFDGELDDTMRRVSSSLPIDLRMAQDDIRGSLAHVQMLGETGILAPQESAAIAGALARIGEEIRNGELTPSSEHEDIHMAVEARLIELIGELGGKLHTARSRNDQVATDVRLWLQRALHQIDAALVRLIQALLERSEADGRTLMPGYTHLQRAQPIWLAHHLLAYAWALRRDRERFRDAACRLDACPAGACALAGTPLPIDRERTAELLGFSRPVANAMDAVAARDHEQEVAAACAICMGHLSRMAEELVVWSSTEFALVRIADRYVTGSSIMPQKRNPDAAELIRGKAARVHGDLTTLLALVKSLPMAYNRDLQEDRAALFDAVDSTLDCLHLMAGMWMTLQVNQDRFAEELVGDACLATEIADAAVRHGVPFRRAHAEVAALVRRLEQQGKSLGDVTGEQLAAVHPALAAERDGLLDPVAAVERRTCTGGTAWEQVQRQIEHLHGYLAEQAPSRAGP